MYKLPLISSFLRGIAFFLLATLPWLLYGQQPNSKMRKLIIKVTPATAFVLIDGSDIQLANGTTTILLPVGSHSYNVMASGYFSESGTITLQSDASGKLIVELDRKTKDGKAADDSPSSANATLSTSVAAAHEYVDLGLPSGTLWATCNVGATKPEEYGDYFAWGETVPQRGGFYNWGTYQLCTGHEHGITKYCKIRKYGAVDGNSELEPEDDAATVNWGSEWCMPTLLQFQELIEKSLTKIKRTQVQGVNGVQITSRKNGNSIFIPACGVYDDAAKYNVNATVYLWSRTLHREWSNQAHLLEFVKNAGVSKHLRCVGLNVRPVRTKH